VVATVLTVSVEDETPAGVGAVSAEKLQASPVGSPEQANEMLELKPPTSCTVIVVVPLCPALTETDAGLMATVKSGCGTLMVYAALATTLGANSESIAIAFNVAVRARKREAA